MQHTVYAKIFYDTSVIFGNFVITYKEPFTGPSSFASVMSDGLMLLAKAEHISFHVHVYELFCILC